MMGEASEPHRGWRPASPLWHVNDPWAVWEQQPSLLVAEVLMLTLFALSTLHAFGRRGSARHQALWFASVLGGACIELPTVLHDQVGNFYHSQAALMLFGRREPLYMLVGCYGWFQYTAVALAWEASRPGDKDAVTEALLAGLLGSLSWGLLDLVGLQQLWWTWHNSEAL